MAHTILIVDDEASILESLQEILEHEGYVVGVAGNGRAALAEVERLRPSLVLTDFMMPHMNGLQLLEALRARPELQELPVVLMSAVHVPPVRGPPLWNAFLGKPFEIDALLQVLRDALGTREERTG
jgi:CheY-like chemotaxis protein